VALATGPDGKHTAKLFAGRVCAVSSVVP
jgi:hypothetical protein